MSPRRLPPVALALAVGLVAMVALAGCGQDGSAGRNALAWEGQPLVVSQPELPDDTIVSGRIRNESDRTLSLDAKHVRIVDAADHPLQSTARFAAAVTHSLYPPGDGPKEQPRELRERLGEVATLKPGESAPLVVSWRVGPGEEPAVRVDLGEGSLKLPSGD